MQTHQLDKRMGRMLSELHGLIARESIAVEGIRIRERGAAQDAPFENGSVWGGAAEWWDFSFSLTVPERFRGRVRLRARTGKESEWEATGPQFIARVNGRIEQALDTKHTTLLLLSQAVPYSAFDIVLNGYVAAPKDAASGRPVLALYLEDVNAQLEQLCYDLYVPYETVKMLAPGSREREITLETLSRAVDLLDLRAPHSEAFDASVERARAYLQAEYYEKRKALPPVAVAEAVGHTHIDVAWLWDLEQTRHKAVRSFSTVLKLMEQYPEYKFMSSQAVLYQMVKEDAPELFERIREAVLEGRWEPEGGMWVEADCNLAGGEALVRQLLHGQTFFLREFGKLSRVLWLPDVFGYSAALPQLLKLAGIDYFMTTKLSWSEFNLSPYDTFTWKGIDGSEVLTHFSPSRPYVEDGDTAGHDGLPHFTTYNAMLAPNMIAGGWQRFQQKGIDDHFLVCYGYGDGGGGPTDWMLENARRMQTPLPELPVVTQQHARPFFEALEARVGADPRLPKWSGELYLEYHRGTYTAMARNKRSNRKMELMLHDVELLCAMAESASGSEYPAEALHKLWEDMLTLQFHDILPGSSIQKVYDDSKIMYEAGFEKLEGLRLGAMNALAAGIRGDVLALNTLSHARDDLLWFDAPETVSALRGEDGSIFPVQHVEGRACAFVRGMRPMGATALFFSEEAVAAEAVRADANGFETPFFKGAFDASMRIASLVEKATGREVARTGEALNRIVCYENKPHNYDAWDINIYYGRRHFEVDQLESVEVVSAGPVLSLLRATYRYMNSSVRQDIYVYNDIGRIDFDTTVNWQEKQYLLKAHFPVDVFYNEATYDIQYGNLRRATHTNTSWDAARFEVCAHKWADVSEEGFGVSLLNDCKYGHSIDERGMALTLLKSSTSPNPIADQETHRFIYSLMPHAGGWREGGTVKAAYQLNAPVLAAKGLGGAAAPISFAEVDAPSVVIESVKRAEDGDGIIVRLYECFGGRAETKLRLGFAPRAAEVCDLLERRLGDAPLCGKEVKLSLRPYQVMSFRIRK